MPIPPTPAEPVVPDEQELALGEFAARLLHVAAAPHRIAALVTEPIGDEIRFGPVPVGPGGLASAVGRGRFGFRCS